MSAPRILIAEDLDVEIEILKMAFARAAIEATLQFVRDGQEVIEHLKRSAENHAANDSLPTMLLLDLKMPRLSGFEVLQWLRAQPGFARLIVVVFTSSAFQEDINRAYELGANSYLVKPAGFPALVETARNLANYWLKMNRPADGIGSQVAEL